MSDIKFTYMYQPPNKYTFMQPKLKKWVEDNCNGKVLNLFCGPTKLNVDEYRVDVSHDVDADWYGDAYDFVTTTDMKFDTIIFDPPYNIRKAREKYDGHWIGSATKIKNELHRIINPSGRVISFGFSSVGMSRSRGFTKKEICLVCHSGDHNDTICVIEELE